jgi:aminoglycoside 6'-N-acetyltransferase
MTDAPDTFEPLYGPRVVLRALTADEIAPLSLALAADENASPWWGRVPATIERWLASPSVTPLAIEVDDEIAGVLTFETEEDPDYRQASADIGLFARWTGQGIGPEALRVLARYLFDQLGHHRMTIDPAATNDRAIAAYTKIGFRPVGVMRRYERGPDGQWRDSLLMDLLAEELT